MMQWIPPHAPTDGKKRLPDPLVWVLGHVLFLVKLLEEVPIKNIEFMYCIYIYIYLIIYICYWVYLLFHDARHIKQMFVFVGTSGNLHCSRD